MAKRNPFTILFPISAEPNPVLPPRKRKRPRNPLRRLFRRHRKYPIQRDELGRSIRQVCFDQFDRGKRPVAVIKEYGFKESTVYRYWADWKKLPGRIREKYQLDRWARKHKADWLDQAAIRAGAKFGLSPEESIAKLREPHGRKNFIAGRWPKNIAKQERGLAEIILTRLMFIVIIGRKLELPPEDIVHQLKASGFGFPEVHPE